jgi:hypothetical protein
MDTKKSTAPESPGKNAPPPSTACLADDLAWLEDIESDDDEVLTPGDALGDFEPILSDDSDPEHDDVEEPEISPSPPQDPVAPAEWDISNREFISSHKEQFWRTFRITDKFSGSPVFQSVVGCIYGGLIGDCFGERRRVMCSNRKFGYTTTGAQLLMACGSIGCDPTLSRFPEALKRFHETKGRGAPGTGFPDHIMGKVLGEPGFIKDPREVARTVFNQAKEDHATNGAIMRAIPCAFFLNASTRVITATQMTHAHPLAVYAGWVLSGICRRLSRGEIPAYSEFIKAWPMGASDQEQEYKSFSSALEPPWTGLGPAEALNRQLVALELDHKGGENHPLRTLGCAVYALNSIRFLERKEANLARGNLFRKVIQNIASRGGDTHTNCAVAGAVLGAYLGFSKLCWSWGRLLKDSDLIDMQTESFLRYWIYHGLNRRVEDAPGDIVRGPR